MGIEIGAIMAVLGPLMGVLTSVIGSSMAGQQPQIPPQSRNLRQTQNITETEAFLPLVYGTARVGGVRCFVDVTEAYRGREKIKDVKMPTSGDYLYMIVAFCKGVIEGYESVLIDAVDSEDEKFNSPFEVDITLSFSYVEPDPVSISSPYSERRAISTFGGGFGWFARPIRYRLKRENLDTGKILEVWKSVGGLDPQEINLVNTDYGNYKFTLEYHTDIGKIIEVGTATVNLTLENDDFVQSVDDNLTVVQNSEQDGEFLKIERKYGGVDNLTSPFFISEDDLDYKSTSLGHDVAYVACRYLKHQQGSKTSQNVFQSLPQTTAVIKGRKVYDPRDSGQDQEDNTTWEWSDNPALCILDYMTNTTDGLAIPYEEMDIDSFENSADYCDELVLRPDGNSTKRYTCNGVLDTEQEKNSNLKELLSCCNGSAIKILGYYRLFIKKAETPVKTFTDHDIIGSITVNKGTFRGKQNQVKAKYTNPDENWQSAFIEVTSDTYKEQDFGKLLTKDFDLPFTTSYDEAKALAIQELKQTRLPTTATFRASFNTYNVTIGDVIKFTSESFGWDEKEFRITKMSDLLDEQRGWVLDYTVEEYSSEVYDIDTYDLQTSYLGTTLTSPFEVAPPSNLQPYQSFSPDFNGDYVNKLTLVWNKSTSQNVLSYTIEYKPEADGTWTTFTASKTRLDINSMPIGRYDFRIKSINNLGFASDYLEKKIEVVTITDTPPEVENFILKNANDQVILSWDYMPEIASNGFFLVKHIPSTIGASWSDVPTFQQKVSGKLTSVALAQVDGTYMIKAINIAGIESPNEKSIVLDLPDDTAWQLVATNQADDTWTGTKVYTFNDGGILKLGSTELFDEATGSFDDHPNNFDYGRYGFSNVGTYTFTDTTDLSGIYKVKLKKIVQATLAQEGLNFDPILGMFEDRLGFFDGTTIFDMSANLFFRSTRDDPSGTPTWSEWTHLTVNNATGRAFQFRLELLKNEVDSQISCEQTRGLVYLPSRVEQGTLAITQASQVVNFDYKFYDIPTLSALITNPATGDYFDISSITRSGFTITVKDSGGNTLTDRTISYIGQGLGQEIIV